MSAVHRRRSPRRPHAAGCVIGCLVSGGGLLMPNSRCTHPQVLCERLLHELFRCSLVDRRHPLVLRLRAVETGFERQQQRRAEGSWQVLWHECYNNEIYKVASTANAKTNAASPRGTLHACSLACDANNRMQQQQITLVDHVLALLPLPPADVQGGASRPLCDSTLVDDVIFLICRSLRSSRQSSD